MKEFAKSFYFSTAWRACRKAYIQQVGGLCEMCLAKGLYKPGRIVHHKIPLTPENITDENITLNQNNLMLVCYDCHREEHEQQIIRNRKKKRFNRYYIDENGDVRTNDTPPYLSKLPYMR